MGAEEALVAARFVHHLSALALFGLCAFAIHGGSRLATAPRGWLVGLVLVALASGAAWLVATVSAMAGAPADADTVRMVTFDTPFGRLWLARTGLAGLTLVAVAAGSRIPAAVLSAGLLASLAWTGHTQTHQGLLGWTHVAADVLHLLAAGAWLGALVAFSRLLRGPGAEAAAALGRFAGTGSLLVAALAASGLVNAWMMLGDVAALWTTAYGRLLLLKLVLFCAMLALAAGNRFWLTPRLATDPLRPGRLKLAVGVELLLGVAVVAVVAVLGTLDPRA